MAAFRSTAKMREARKAAIARLRDMSHDEILKNSLANQDSITVAFLAACQGEQPFLVEHQTPGLVMREEFTVASRTMQQGAYHYGSSLSAAVIFCAQALQSTIIPEQSSDELFAAAA